MSAHFDYATVAPDAVKALSGISRYVLSSGLDHKLVHLIYLRVSQMNGCAYCCNMHSQDALKVGESDQRLHVVAAWREAENLFSESEQAALGWAEVLTRFPDARAADVAARDQAYRNLLEYHSEKQAVDLTFAIAAMNAWNRVSVAFHKQPDKSR